ncbi:HupE/UreJ family protein [Polaribacter sp.]|uniref:HupE/UreJ family protein n=1 Tax=Polaribacter sp. TaxID=1920175 RepID=UPI003EF9AC30
MLNFSSFLNYFKIGVRHVLRFSYLNYILFLILSVIVFNFKQWKKLLWLVISIVLSYFIAIILAVYGNVVPQLPIIKFLILLTIFSLAIKNIWGSFHSFKNTEKYIFLHAVLFAFFNGLGSSSVLLLNLESNESEFFPIIEVVLGTGASVFLMVLGLITVFTFLRLIPKVSKINSTIICSLIIIGIILPKIIGQIF